ncbi:hypothetical protein Snas_0769 [Stackebrandtia nassauensis DSM 44728]|uniref:Uncharacterized protein n=1 Tax=Stackebrandtia nassauensis (strain DSM 44728 / CIP 108903 / NRRL B-16338 / NBRC 102104 / LLR-40K-21) TaxID=446470 RepID=D3Q7X6_STANL|nr:hypothetical protein Snas_0769 [Stackebrandtia nassauensis DSM 44728]
MLCFNGQSAALHRNNSAGLAACPLTSMSSHVGSVDIVVSFG